MPVSLMPKIVDNDAEKKKHDAAEKTVEKYMTKKVVTVNPDTPIYDAIDILIRLGITGMPVVDEGNKLVGMISEVDCLPILSNRAYHSAQAGNVSEYMSTNLKTVSPEMNLMDLIPFFTEKSYRRLPVVKNGKLVGQISRRDVLLAIHENHQTSGA